MRRGLFVGIDEYQNGITPLRCAVNDAQRLSYGFTAAGAAVHFLKLAKEKLEKLINDLPVPEKFSGKVNLPGGYILEMVQIEPGTFIMGSPESAQDHCPDEKQHQVTLTKRFYLGKYPVTQKEYQAVMGNNPSNFKGDNLPVEEVSWDDAKRFCSKLNDLKHNELPAGYRFDLPTEAQWEYACRSGTTTAYCW
ncbi:MAG: formylglycine-generating enzyme family protein, partial [Lentisphaeria bacterium]|nr:formylglycine-generating enzyme family protein [Lentisphaeria bacterium]